MPRFRLCSACCLFVLNLAFIIAKKGAGVHKISVQIYVIMLHGKHGKGIIKKNPKELSVFQNAIWNTGFFKIENLMIVKETIDCNRMNF